MRVLVNVLWPKHMNHVWSTSRTFAHLFAVCLSVCSFWSSVITSWFWRMEKSWSTVTTTSWSEPVDATLSSSATTRWMSYRWARHSWSLGGSNPVPVLCSGVPPWKSNRKAELISWRRDLSTLRDQDDDCSSAESREKAPFGALSRRLLV